MRSVKLAICAATLTLGATIVSANAQEVATVQNCLATGAQLKTALEANTQSANYQDAMKERNTGLLYCNSGFYERGISHYSHALQLLGVAQHADASH